MFKVTSPALSSHPEVSGSPFYRRLVSMRSESLPGYRKRELIKEGSPTVEKAFNKALKHMGLPKDKREQAKVLLFEAASKLYDVATTGSFFDENATSAFQTDYEQRDRMKMLLFGEGPSQEELEARAKWKPPLRHTVCTFDSYNTSLGELRHEHNFPDHAQTMLGLYHHTNEVSLTLDDTNPTATLTYHYPYQTHRVKDAEIMNPNQLDGVWELKFGRGAYAISKATPLDRSYYIYPIFPDDYPLLSYRETIEYLNYRIKTYHC